MVLCHDTSAAYWKVFTLHNVSSISSSLSFYPISISSELNIFISWLHLYAVFTGRVDISQTWMLSFCTCCRCYHSLVWVYGCRMRKLVIFIPASVGIVILPLSFCPSIDKILTKYVLSLSSRVKLGTDTNVFITWQTRLNNSSISGHIRE